MRVIETKLVPIESLEPYPGNPRRGNLEVIRESLRANGQYRPIIVVARCSATPKAERSTTRAGERSGRR